MTIRDITIQIAKMESTRTRINRFGEVECVPVVATVGRETFTYENGELIAYDYELPQEAEER